MFVIGLFIFFFTNNAIWKVEKARQELEQLGFSCYETQIGGPGVRAWC
jgi:hypothetical protein